MNQQDALKQEFNDREILTDKEVKARAREEANVRGKGVNPHITVGNPYFKEYNEKNGKTGLNKNKRSNFFQIHGCKECLWRGTKHCYLNNEMNIFFDRDAPLNTVGHKEGICEYKGKYIMSMRDEFLDGKGLGVVKERLFKRMLDDSWVAAYRKNKALQEEGSEDSEIYWKQALDWAKYASDVELRLLKHVEGVKVDVKQTVKPSDIANMLHNARKERVVDAEVVDEDE